MTGDRHSFSVGVDDVTDDKRREVFDGIAILAGWPYGPKGPRDGNHVGCMERLIAAAHELMLTDPAQFAMFLGEGEPRNGKNFLAFVKKLKGSGQPQGER